MAAFDPVRTGVFNERATLGEGRGGEGRGSVFTHPQVYLFVCKPRVLKFGTQLKRGKIYHKK